MLLDLQSQKIYAHPYKEFKAELSERSQVMLAADYEKAIAKNKIVVFAWRPPVGAPVPRSSGLANRFR